MGALLAFHQRTKDPHYLDVAKWVADAGLKTTAGRDGGIITEGVGECNDDSAMFKGA